jgi:hypothetical protein
VLVAAGLVGVEVTRVDSCPLPLEAALPALLLCCPWPGGDYEAWWQRDYGFWGYIVVLV